MSLSEVISGECATRPQEMSDAAAVGLYPLSFAQQRLWFLDQLQPGNPAYNIPMAWRLEGPLDIPALQRSLGELVRRHEVLRTRFAAADGQPFQLVTPAAPFELPFRDLSAEPDPEAKARRLIQDAARQPFDLQRGPLFRAQLFRLREHEHIAFFNLHHLVADGWSFEILRREVGVFYAAFCAGTEPNLPELPIQYLDYAHWQREQWRGQALQMELEFWKQRLAGELPALELPGDLPRTGLKSYEGRSAPFELTAELAGALRELGSREGATLFMLLLAAFSAFIHRLTGADEFVIGAPVSDRSRTETEGLIGLFVHTVALRMDLRGDPTFCDLLARARDTTLGALAHQEIPFEEVVKALQPERALDRNPLFQVVLALQGGFLRQWKWGDLRATLLEVETGTAKFDWTFLLEETDWGVKGRLEYNTDLFEAGLIESFLQHFQSLLQGIVAEPGRRISELPLMTPVERNGLLADMNQTATDYERDAGIHDVFEAQVKRTPDAVALVFGDEQWTYDELNRRANQLAHRLQLAGVEPEVRVGLAMERSLEMLVAMLAILKAGGAYVPLDRSYPRQRLAFMLQDADVSVLVTDARSEVEQFQTARREKPLTVIRLDAASENSNPNSPENLRSGATAENLAYVIYTSGSTGTPKGAAIPHRAVVRLVRHTNYVRFLPNDVFLQLAPISFDASTFEIWGCLLNGGRLVIFPPHLPSLEELGRAIQQHQVTTLWLTAGLFHQMVDHQLESLKSVRQLLAGGDVLSVPHVLKALRALPGCQLINGYGPTENTTFTCCYRVPPDWSGGNSVPIGKPISNTHVYVLDENLSLVPTGVPGELCVGGDGLARGYLNRPELTAETFIPNPFASDTQRAEPRLYRTGDRVRLRQDGQLEFLGRSDQQVKIRGFRVELGEIEAALAQHPSVREAVVLARQGSSDDRQLVAYIVSPPAGPSGGELRTFLADKLPAHMLPAHFVALDQLPLTANGKVDRRALPALEETVMHLVVEPTGSPPRNPVEATLLEIWRGLLGRGSFGIHENFFYLGGHSLLVTRMISRILKEFQIELPVRAVFEAPTVAALAERISTTPHTAIHGPAVPNRRRQRAQARQLLARLDELSEAEIESLLEVPHRKSVVS